MKTTANLVVCVWACVCSIMWFIFDWEPCHSFWGQPPNQSTAGRAYQDGLPRWLCRSVWNHRHRDSWWVYHIHSWMHHDRSTVGWLVLSWGNLSLGPCSDLPNPTTKTNGARRVRGMQCHCKVTVKDGWWAELPHGSTFQVSESLQSAIPYFRIVTFPSMFHLFQSIFLTRPVLVLHESWSPLSTLLESLMTRDFPI